MAIVSIHDLELIATSSFGFSYSGAKPCLADQTRVVPYDHLAGSLAVVLMSRRLV